MPKVHACLLGEWVCLNDDPNCKIGRKGLSPASWLDSDTEIYAPVVRTPDMNNKYNEQNYIEIHYNGENYRINPIFIQVTGF